MIDIHEALRGAWEKILSQYGGRGLHSVSANRATGLGSPLQQMISKKLDSVCSC